MNIKRVGEIVKNAREAKGISQLELAKKVGICRYAIIELEQKGKVPKWVPMVKIQKLLGVKKDTDKIITV